MIGRPSVADMQLVADLVGVAVTLRLEGWRRRQRRSGADGGGAAAADKATS